MMRIVFQVVFLTAVASAQYMGINNAPDKNALVRPVAAQARGQVEGRHPDFEGIWNSATATPLERPAQFKDKPFFTPDEAAAWERQASVQNYDVVPRVLKSLRTSIITDPTDGRIPALMPAAAAEKRRRQELLQHPRNAKDMDLQVQCLIFPTAAPPMIPYRYNSNYQIIETGGEVVVHAEMIHDTRVIHLDGRPHVSPNVRLWLGDSAGRWEGGTLVVETTNFNDAGAAIGSDRNLRVVERFSLLDPNTILYQFEVEDPTAFTRPWKGELTMARSSGRIYEDACHEGNYTLPNLLNGFRAGERDEPSLKPR
jgi:hypothetical protein